MEIVHIAGCSCVGKRTLITRLGDPKEPDLRSRFGIKGSTERYWHDEPNDLEFNRKFDPTPWRPIEEMATAEYDHLFHKWQDRSDSWIEKLRDIRPNIPQRIIFLWQPCSIIQTRMIEKGRENPTIENVQGAMKYFSEKILKRRLLGIPVEIVDATSRKYPQLQKIPGY